MEIRRRPRLCNTRIMRRRRAACQQLVVPELTAGGDVGERLAGMAGAGRFFVNILARHVRFLDNVAVAGLDGAGKL